LRAALQESRPELLMIDRPILGLNLVTHASEDRSARPSDQPSRPNRRRSGERFRSIFPVGDE
jgi:hypothetical protein